MSSSPDTLALTARRFSEIYTTMQRLLHEACTLVDNTQHPVLTNHPWVALLKDQRDERTTDPSVLTICWGLSHVIGDVAHWHTNMGDTPHPLTDLPRLRH